MWVGGRERRSRASSCIRPYHRSIHQLLDFECAPRRAGSRYAIFGDLAITICSMHTWTSWASAKRRTMRKRRLTEEVLPESSPIADPSQKKCLCVLKAVPLMSCICHWRASSLWAGLDIFCRGNKNCTTCWEEDARCDCEGIGLLYFLAGKYSMSLSLSKLTVM